MVELTGDTATVLDDQLRAAGDTLPLAELERLPPTAPSKIIGVGRNYRAHAQELGNATPTSPLLFFKPPSSVIADGGVVRLPSISSRVDYEAELGVVIGSRARRVPQARALDYVLGYLPVCDVTARDLQKTDGQWTRGKGFDTSCPIGSCITAGVDASSLDIQLKLNGEVKQAGNTQDMVFGIRELIAHISQVITLEPGDIIATGTPEGVGPLAHGDQVEISIEHVGELSFCVEAENQ